MALVAAASALATRALPTVGAAVIAATLSGAGSVQKLRTARQSVEALIGAFREAKEDKVFIGKNSVLKFYETQKEAEKNLVRHLTASLHDYGPAMVSREVGVMSLPEPRYYLIFEKLAPFSGELTPEQRASLRAKLTLMHERGKHAHGDLHAGNILVKPDGGLVFSDFDLGRDVPRTKPAANKQLRNELGLIDELRPQVMQVGYGRPFV